MDTQLAARIKEKDIDLILEMANFDERRLRLFAGWLVIASENDSIENIENIAKATGVSPNTVKAGMRELLKQVPYTENCHIGKDGAGQKLTEFNHSERHENIDKKSDEMLKKNS